MVWRTPMCEQHNDSDSIRARIAVRQTADHRALRAAKKRDYLDQFYRRGKYAPLKVAVPYDTISEEERLSVAAE